MLPDRNSRAQGLRGEQYLVTMTLGSERMVTQLEVSRLWLGFFPLEA